MVDDDARYYLHAEAAAASDRFLSRGRTYARFKRFMDIGLTIAAAPFALAIVGAVAPFVRLDGGTIFLRQPRIGRGGRIFDLWKIRTMVPDADQRFEAYLEENPLARQEWESNQKLKDDPRITWIGRYLRKYSIDELPQLLNVLRGEMSLVGPRPMLPDQRKHYPGTAYYLVRPGLTGLWQIGDRNACSFAERATYDTRYLDAMSFVTDLQILMMTPLAVFKGTGI